MNRRTYYFFFAIAGLLLFGAAHNALADIAPKDCQGPYAAGQMFDATSAGAPYNPDPTPKNNQFFCSNIGDTAVPPNTYRCEETSAQQLYCRNYQNPTTDYYTCTYLGFGPRINHNYYNGLIFDNCTYSLVPPTLSFSAVPSSISLGQSATLSWSSNATSCTASGGWSGAQNVSGSQPVTPSTTTTYNLACTGASTVSRSVTVTVIIPDTVSPSVPGVLTAAAISSSQINLAWTASTDTGGSGLAGYRIERCMGTGCASFVQIASVSAISFSDAGLAPSTSYNYRVRAYDGANNQSGYSNIATDVTQTPPDSAPPSAPTLSGSAFSSTQINLAWTASTDTGGSGLAGYRVYRDGTLIATVGSAVTAYFDLGRAPSTAYSYYVRPYDGAGNSAQSNTVNVSTPATPDTTPPTFTFSSPAATLSAGTTFATLAGSTNENATCRYATTAGLLFASMPYLFSPGNTTNHSATLTGLADGTIYTYYVKCRDGSGNANTADFSYMFQVDAPAPDTAPPVISNGAPSGMLAANTTSTVMNVITNENAYCRYNQNSDTAFSSMTNALNSANFRNHSVSLTGLANGSSYLYYVRCQDTPAGNTNTIGYVISFSVAFPANGNPVALMNVAPTSGTASLVVSADGSVSYDIDGSIAQYILRWGDGTPDTSGVPSASHTYNIAGTYVLQLTVIDNQGGSGNTSQTISVTATATPPPSPISTSICTAACTTNADCTPNICGPSGFCIAQGGGSGPVRFDGYLSRADGSMSQPTPAVFPAGTASVVMSVKTDVNADCQYSTFINTPYGASVMKTFSTTGTTAHSVTLTGLGSVTAAAYDYYIRCRDLATDIVNDADYAISFTANAPNIVSGPNPYTCLINPNFIRNNIPYLFDICIPR